MSDDTVYHFIKATRADGRDFHTGKIDYAAAVGGWLEVDTAPASEGQCAAGIHASPLAIQCCWAMRGHGPRPWRFFELVVEAADVVWPSPDKIATVDKVRCRRVFVARELAHDDVMVFGESIGRRVEALRAEAGTWRAIP